MVLKKLLEGMEYEVVQGSAETIIEDICYDSRKVKPNDAFVCLVGIDTDGHQYVEEVISRGCRCIIACREIVVAKDVTVIQIADTRKQLSLLSANLFDHPDKQLIKIAITGTKGKTSTSWMIKSILETAHEKVGLIGTLGTYIDGKLQEHKNTTPEAYLIQKFMREMADSGVKYLVMETSSQALKVGRVHNILFDYGIFTNLSIDHVGPREHASYEEYRDSKAQLFRQCQVGIFNQDDKETAYMIQKATCQIYTYGKENSDLLIDKMEAKNTEDFLGMAFQTKGLVQKQFMVPAPGDFSVYNASAAILLTHLLGIPDSIIQKGLRRFYVLGRAEILNVDPRFKVVIDFAHNKISMESIMKTMRSYHPKRMVAIFGCGGGRSFERRYELGVTAGELSDLSIITMDNPRNDSLEEIIHDIKAGVESVKGNYLVIPDRKEAIIYALEQAQEGDIILLLGKGHETYQEVLGKRIEFDEKEIVQTYFKERKNGNSETKL